VLGVGASLAARSPVPWLVRASVRASVLLELG
jgi:hypothetical protein